MTAGRRPDFLIAGEAKCGTTTLYEMLGRNPRVFFPAEKELHFFASYRFAPGHGRLDTHGIEPYLRHFGDARSDQVCGEATPNYLFDERACERIQSVLPDVRLVAILRDPVERAWSHYWHQVRRGGETLGFEQALEAEAQRLEAGDADEREQFSYCTRGRYVENLRRYESRFSREQLCVVFLEDLRRDPRAVIERVSAHLGVGVPEEAEAFALPHANRASYPKWPRLARSARSARRWLEAKSAVLAGPVRSLARSTRSLRVYSGAPRMDEATRRALRESFAASDRELGEWLGRRPPWLDA